MSENLTLQSGEPNAPPLFRRSRVRRGSGAAGAATMVVTMAVLAALPAPPAHAFSGEDPLFGKPWYHRQITRVAAKQAGFTFNPTKDTPAWKNREDEAHAGDKAAEALAWHADQIDSYLYNPKWWVEGGLDRFKVSMATYDELAKLHFDDLFSADQVRRAFKRYLTGTMAGLVWAKEHDDVGAARNIVAVSLHAIQDFYSHSSWMDDPARRKATWFDYPKVTRDKMFVFTGAYEHPEHLGVKHHGKPAPLCTLMNQSGAGPMMDIACAGISPLSNGSLCAQYKECKEGVTTTGLKIKDVAIPGNVVYYAPPGIALDSEWMAAIGIKQRGLTGVTSKEMFEGARNLATTASVQWLKILQEQMTTMGNGAFWKRLQSEVPASMTKLKSDDLEVEYESYHKFPYMFLTAGPYPPPLNTPEEQYYLRVRLKTSTENLSGTNSDIYLWANGDPYLLDYLPKANPALAYNDFEAGDDGVYMVGPFPSVPSSVMFENRSASGGDVLAALGNSFAAAMDTVATGIGDFLKGIVGADADVIGKGKKIWKPDDLKTVGTTPQPFSITVKGGNEGTYRVDGTIRKTKEGVGTASTEDWAEYTIRLRELLCVKEGDWDRGSDSDEPFLLALVVPLPGGILQYRTEPYTDVDDGEKNPLNIDCAPVRVSKSYGMISLPITIMEHDDEGVATRNELLKAFAGKAADATKDEKQGFTDALGAAIAADWKLQHMNVYAFARGRNVRAGTVFNKTVNTWIPGKGKVTFALNPAGLKSWAVDAEKLQQPVFEWNPGFNNTPPANPSGKRPIIRFPGTNTPPDPANDVPIPR